MAKDKCTGLFELNLKSIIMAAEEAILCLQKLVVLYHEPVSSNDLWWKRSDDCGIDLL